MMGGGESCIGSNLSNMQGPVGEITARMSLSAVRRARVDICMTPAMNTWDAKFLDAAVELIQIFLLQICN